MDSSRPSHLIEVLQAIETFYGLCWKYASYIYYLYGHYCIMYWKIVEKFVVSLFSPSLQIQWFIQAISRCCAAARRSFNSKELNFYI